MSAVISLVAAAGSALPSRRVGAAAGRAGQAALPRRPRRLPGPVASGLQVPHLRCSSPRAGSRSESPSERPGRVPAPGRSGWPSASEEGHLPAVADRADAPLDALRDPQGPAADQAVLPLDAEGGDFLHRQRIGGGEPVLHPRHLPLLDADPLALLVEPVALRAGQRDDLPGVADLAALALRGEFADHVEVAILAVDAHRGGLS